MGLSGSQLKLARIIFLFIFLGCISCKKEPEEDTGFKPFKRVLILGNSITQHPPAPEVGWYGNWGMAASAPEKDFVHLLTDQFEAVNPQVDVKYQNISGFEKNYWQYDLGGLDTLRSFAADLLILRIGENVDVTLIGQHDFKKHYLSLIQYFKQQNPEIKIICAAGFWESEPIETIIAACSAETGSPFVQLSSLSDVSYTAWGLFSNYGVATHPSDKGMQAIADLIWEEVVKL